LAIFFIKVKTALIYSSYLPSLLQIIEAFICNPFVFQALYQSTCLSTHSCNEIKCYLEVTHHCL
jgi:hypothetical protein